jgi:spermidine/putrescine transport system permease protein
LGLGRWFHVSVVVLTVVFLYVPVLTITYFSVAPTAQPDVPIQGFSLEWYDAVLSDDRFIRGLRSSFLIGGVVAVLGTVLGTIGAYTLVRSRLPRWMRGLVGVVIALPLFVPTVVIALGIGLFAGRVDLGFGYTTTVLGHLAWVLPFSTFLIAARYAELDDQLTDAARDLGATNREITRTVTLPLLAPALVAAGLFCFTLSFNEFLITFMLAGGDVTTMPLQVFGKVRRGATSFLNAASVLILLIGMVVAGVASLLERPTY